MKISINGCSGRMGKTLVSAVLAHGDCTLAALGIAPGENENDVRSRLDPRVRALPVTSDARALVAGADVVIDFTAPEASVALARICAETGCGHVIGTTGFDAVQQNGIAAAAKAGARIVQSGNFSLCVNVLSVLVEQAARLLSDDYDIEIDEMHHRMKKDSPSGTALLLGRAAANGRGVDFDSAKNHYGEGMIGERVRGSIGMSARRGGEVVGVHTVTFAGPGENLELTHRGFSRETYAQGALKAAFWLQGKAPGLYSMRDVLGI